MQEHELVLELKKREKIIIYGAGMVGGLVYSRLASNGLGNYILGFAVTKKTIETYLSVPVYEISELASYKVSANIVIATLPSLHEEILDILMLNGFRNVWNITDALYNDMSSKYISDFKKRNILEDKVVDVLLMASDNCFSSGAFLCMTDLSVELSARGISNVVVLPEYGNGEEILIKKNISFTYIPSRHWAKKIGEEISDSKKNLEEINKDAIKEIEDFIVQHQVKLVHNNTSYTYVGAIAAKHQGIPFIWHIRENIFEQGFEFINEKEAIGWFNQSEKIIAVSKFIVSCYQGLDSSKICVCYDGVNIKDYYNKEKKIFENKKLVIAQIGAITPAKNQKDLIEAAYILKSRNLNFQVQIIGNGDADYIRELQELIQRFHLQEEVIFYGRQADIRRFYQNIDIVTVCSRAEPFGRTTIEAQLAGCLVVGATAGATPELIEDGKTGFLYKKGNSEELAEKIIYAFLHPELSRKIILSGQKYSYKRYTKEHNAEDILKVYRSCQREKTRFYYANDMVEKLKNSKQLVVFSAGFMAQAVVYCLTSDLYQLHITYCLVSDSKNNPKEVLGVPVVDLSSAEGILSKDVTILIASGGPSLESMEKNLRQYGYTCWIPVIYEGDLWSYLRGNYYRAYCLAHHKLYLTLEEELSQIELDKNITKHSVNIYTARCHVDKRLEEDISKYTWETPIQVGADLTTQRICEVCDNIGNNISYKNQQYCEVTALYWIWKHDTSEYIGLGHYRRHFEVDDKMLRKLSCSDIDVVFTIPIFDFPNVREVYRRDHVEKDWLVMMEAIQVLFPEYLASALELQEGNFYYAYNMFIMRRPILDGYCQWLFPILEYCEMHCEEKVETYHKRYIGFLAEHLMAVYFLHHEKDYKIVHAKKHFIER